MSSWLKQTMHHGDKWVWTRWGCRRDGKDCCFDFEGCEAGFWAKAE